MYNNTYLCNRLSLLSVNTSSIVISVLLMGKIFSAVYCWVVTVIDSFITKMNMHGYIIIIIKGTKIFQKHLRDLKILGARQVK